MIWDGGDVMDRWPAAAFRARCVLAEALDRLWHLVSAAVQRNDLGTRQERGAEKDCIWRDVRMGRRSCKVIGDIWKLKSSSGTNWKKQKKKLARKSSSRIWEKEWDGGAGNACRWRAWEGPCIPLLIPCSHPIKISRGPMLAFSSHPHIMRKTRMEKMQIQHRCLMRENVLGVYLSIRSQMSIPDALLCVCTGQLGITQPYQNQFASSPPAFSFPPTARRHTAQVGWKLLAISVNVFVFYVCSVQRAPAVHHLTPVLYRQEKQSKDAGKSLSWHVDGHQPIHIKAWPLYGLTYRIMGAGNWSMSYIVIRVAL